jgi:hypothetical protein
MLWDASRREERGFATFITAKAPAAEVAPPALAAPAEQQLL